LFSAEEKKKLMSENGIEIEEKRLPPTPNEDLGNKRFQIDLLN
jgi:hypothetical protein